MDKSIAERNLPPAIAAIVGTPGKYIVATARGLTNGYVMQIEVDESGVIHQLDPFGARDGVLEDDGWIKKPSTEVMVLTDEQIKEHGLGRFTV